MRFLCLHGRGANNRVFESQTAALRYQLGDQHEFDFVEGSTPWPQAPEIKHVFPADDRYYSYFIEGDDKEVQSALVDLRQYVESQGPFDAVMAFSQGATLSAIFIALYGNKYFKFAIFICGGVPPKDGGWSAKFTNSQSDGTITIPTGHILGRQDDLYAAGIELSEFCSKSNRLIMEHGGGHEVPKGDKASADMSRLVNDIIARTLFAQ